MNDRDKIGNKFRGLSFAVIGVLLSLVGCSDVPEKAHSPVNRPNIILILIDDLGYGDLGSYGSELHQTPHMDRLADGGMRFTDFHTNGPVCSPTRAALMTGQYQQRSGIEAAIGFVKDEGVPLGKITMAEVLSDAGYSCGVVGKWHLGHVSRFGPNDQGFDFSVCSNNSPDYHSHVSRNGMVDWYKDHELYQEKGYLTELVTRHSTAFIDQNKEGPFFLFVSHLAVHFPFQGPADPPFRTEGQEWHGSERIVGQVEPDSKYGPLPPEEYKRSYRDMIEAVDDSVGAIVKTLDKLNLREETLIVITSDNGAYSWVGSNGVYRGQKQDLFEGGHRVPAIFNWPVKIPGETVSDATTMTMDLAPTFSALANAEDSTVQSFDGIDLGQVLFKQASLPSRTLFWRFGDSYAVRKNKWKYMVQGGGTYLFDLSEDPGEQTNLAEDYPDRIQDMDRSFRAWENEVTSSTQANN